MSTAGKSYEAWKESLKQAETGGDEECSETSWPFIPSGLAAMESKGLGAALLVGVVLLFASAVVLLVPNFRHLTWGKRTVGMVVGHKDFYGRGPGNILAPVVSYSAPGGVYRAVGCLSVPRSTYPMDKEVSVLYLPKDPSNAVVADFVQMFLIPTIVGGLGLICLTSTSGLMFWTVRQELAAHPTVTAPKKTLPAPDQFPPDKSDEESVVWVTTAQQDAPTVADDVADREMEHSAGSCKLGDGGSHSDLPVVGT